jgi:hypothetical protein
MILLPLVLFIVLLFCRIEDDDEIEKDLSRAGITQRNNRNCVVQ